MKTLPLSPHALQTAALARELLAAHGLTGWSFRLNRSQVNLGLCRYGPRTVELSSPFVEHNPEEVVRDTLLHEVAHALVAHALVGPTLLHVLRPTLPYYVALTKYGLLRVTEDCFEFDPDPAAPPLAVEMARASAGQFVPRPDATHARSRER